MKWLLGLLIFLASCGIAEAQTRTYYTGSTPTGISVYNFNFNTSPGISRGSCQSLPPFTPSGVTTPMNGRYTRPTQINELDSMNLSFVVKVQSLPPHLYKVFSKAVNAMPTKRSAMLRRLIYELPSRMEGTTYVPPSQDQIFEALRKVYYSTDAEVEAYWRNR